MKTRYVPKVLGLILLLAGLSIGSDRSKTRGEESDRLQAMRQVTVADCNYQRDPDGYRFALRRHIEQLAAESSAVVDRRKGPSDLTGRDRLQSLSYDLPSRSYIDDHIFGKMRQDGVPHAALASDTEFLRRVYLDLTGRIPSAEKVRSFVSDDNPKKRSDLISSLIGSPEYVDKWTMWFGDLLKNTSTDTYFNRFPEGRNAFYTYIKNAIDSDMPYDVFAGKILASVSTNNTVDGEANWLIGCQTPMGPVQDTYDTQAVRAATQFLGVSNLDCLLCHDGKGHLDKLNVWAAGVKRSEAWGMSAFFSRYRLGARVAIGTTTSFYWPVTEAATGDYLLNTTSGNRVTRAPVNGSNLVRPKYLFSTNAASGATYRDQLANYVVRDRQFARAAVNYLWRELMGMGIVEPADQFDPARLDPKAALPDGWTIQPSHPELLEALADDFIASGYNIRKTLSKIVNSNAYQLSSRFVGDWKLEYETYFARKNVRRLWGEEVHDAITQATSIGASYTPRVYTAPVLYAMQLPEPGNNEPVSNGGVSTFLNYFLRGNRDQNPRSDEATILQALNMMNNNFIMARIHNTNVGSRVQKLLADKSVSDDQLVEDLYLNTLSRFPTPVEVTTAKAALKANRTLGAENLHWALLNKVDFLYNY